MKEITGTNIDNERHFLIYIKTNDKILFSYQIHPKKEIIFKGSVITEQELIDLLEKIEK